LSENHGCSNLFLPDHWSRHRRVYVSGMTTHPDTAWVAQQARNFSVHLAERREEASYLIHNRDTKFTAQFDAMLEAEGITIKEPTAKSPNLTRTISEELL